MARVLPELADSFAHSFTTLRSVERLPNMQALVRADHREHQICISVVGFQAVIVVNDLAPVQHSVLARLDDEAVLEHVAVLAGAGMVGPVDEHVAVRVDVATALPRPTALSDGGAPSVARKVRHRLALHVAQATICARGGRRGFAASALAQANGGHVHEDNIMLGTKGG